MIPRIHLFFKNCIVVVVVVLVEQCRDDGTIMAHPALGNHGTSSSVALQQEESTAGETFSLNNIRRYLFPYYDDDGVWFGLLPRNEWHFVRPQRTIARSLARLLRHRPIGMRSFVRSFVL